MPKVVVTFLASFLIWFMFGGLFYLWIFKKGVKKEQVVHALVASVIAFVISEVIKILFPTIRPFEVNGEQPLTITVPFHGAFPSVHTSVSFGLATSTWMYDKRTGIAFLLSSFFVGLGRLFGNVHYFLDVAFGAILGIMSAYMVSRLHLYKLLGKRA
jgi:undecaprenyl-diphosphatase